MKAVKRVIHYGPAYHLTDFCQQIGRAGRNTGDHCSAKLFTFPEVGNLISHSMKSYIASSNESCLRVSLFTPFNDTDVPVVPVIPGHLCCSYCLALCQCGSEEFHPLKDTDTSDTTASSPTPSPIKGVSKSETFVDILLELQESYINKCPVLAPTRVISGITRTLIKRIVEHLPFNDSVKCIKNHFNLNFKVANDIGIAIKELFGDSEEGEYFKDIINGSDMEIEENEFNDDTIFDFSDFTFSSGESLSDSDY